MNLLVRYTKLLRLTLLLLATGQLTAQAQQTLTLSDRDGTGIIFDGNVFQAGTQFGNASIYAKFGGTGTKSFQIDSPGENLTKTITADGFFDIIPSGSTIIDQTKIKNFSGTITGSVVITVRPLTITTTGIDAVADVAPGTLMSVSYVTGTGTFPIDLNINGFKVQLLDANSVVIKDMLNSTDQLTSREQRGVSKGDTRVIKATLPSDVTAGTYRLRVVTQGLIQNINGSASAPFTVKGTTAASINPGSVGTTSYCAGTTVSFPLSTSGAFGSGNAFKVQLSDVTGTTFQDLAGTSTTSSIAATLPASLASGSYKFRITASDPATVSTPATIHIAATPTLTISGNSVITSGSPATVQLAFTGTPPWSLTYIDNSPDYAPTFTRAATFSASTATITPTLFGSTTYDASSIKSFKDAGCGLSAQIKGAATITTGALTITTLPVAQSYCPGTPVSVSFTANGKLPTDANYIVQLSDENGNFQKAQVISASARTSPIVATPNKDMALIAGTGYKIMVVPQKGTPDYTTTITSVPTALLLSRPPLPGVTDVSYCPGTAPSQLTAIGTNLQWYITSDSIALQGPPTPPPNQSSKYLVRQIVNGCASSLATINVAQGTPPSAPSVSNVALCQGGSGQFSSSLTGALWYTAATGGVGTAQPPVVNSQAAGDQTFYVSQTINGCESARATVKIAITPSPAPPVVPATNPVCQNVPASPLVAVGTNLTWYDQSGKLTGTPTPNTSTAGVKSYSVTQTVAGCESARSPVNQTILAAPANPTADAVRYCVGDKPNALTATGSNLKWYTTQTGGTSNPTSPNFLTTSAATFTFYVTQTDNIGCESQRQPVSVAVVSAPAAPTVIPNQVVCQLAQVGPLSASPGSGLVWQGTGITGTSETAPTPVTSQPGTFTYSVAQKAGSCLSQASVITFVVQKSPDAPSALSPVNFCVGQTSVSLSATATGSASTLTWYTNADRSGSPLSQVTPATAQAGTTTYYVTQYILQSDGKKCESPTTAVEVRVQAKATATLFGDGEINLGDSTAIRVRLTGNGPWKFIRWDKILVETSDSLYIKWERPDSTKTYEITSFSGACGLGNILNDYTLLVKKPLGVELQSSLLLLITYPNPTTDILSINWNAPVGEIAELQLFSLEGQTVKRLSRQSTGINQLESFQLSNQPPGMYFLKLSTPKSGVLTKAIMKQ